MRLSIKIITITTLSIICLSFAQLTLAINHGGGGGGFEQFENTTGDKTITTTTVVSGDKWIEDGNLTISPGVTLQIDPNSSLTFEPGYHISKSGAYITKNVTNAEIRKAAVSCATPVTCYPDNDDDGYGASSAQTFCETCPAGYASNNQDCYDYNADARPGQMNYRSANRGDGSYDYNCDGVEEKWDQFCRGCTTCQASGTCSATTCGSGLYSTVTPTCGNWASCGQEWSYQQCHFHWYSPSCVVGEYSTYTEDTEHCSVTGWARGVIDAWLEPYIEKCQCR